MYNTSFLTLAWLDNLYPDEVVGFQKKVTRKCKKKRGGGIRKNINKIQEMNMYFMDRPLYICWGGWKI